MQKPLVSVVIPAYNEEKRIKKCLRTVFKQDFPQDSYEVVVVDNNSQDKTIEIVKKTFPKARIVKENQQGTVFARIKGAQEAKGEIVAMTDSDSQVPQTWLKKIFKAYEDKEVVAVGGMTQFEYQNNFISFCQFCINYSDLLLKISPGYNLSFRKKAYFQCGGFSPKINLGEDFYLALKIKQLGKVVFLKDNPVVVSSRRFFDGYFSYASKYIINVLTIFVFDKPLFFKFKEVRQETRSALAYLKQKAKY
ncbi:MAG TPA: glycosyltransferase [Clostridia bacterium]|nr:glycosyltransferase [Clostridia bacterium]